MRTSRTVAALGLAIVGLAACNAITGAHDRIVDTTTTEPADDADAPVLPGPVVEGGLTDRVVPPAVDAGTDAGATTFSVTIGTTWTSPNNAKFSVDEDGTAILPASNGSTENHGVLVPTTQPALPSDDYTILATFIMKASSEFGVVTRVQADGSAVVFGSRYGDHFPAQNAPFLGLIGPTAWEPTGIVSGDPYDTVGLGSDVRYKMKVIASQQYVYGKLWLATDPEPDRSARLTTALTTGRGVGAYAYLSTANVVLVDMTVTVP